MIKIAVAYVATLVVFLVIDMIWLTQVGPSLYKPVIGSIMAPEPRLGAAAVFYAIFIAGLLYFAVLPALAGDGWTAALLKGAIFGFCAYATYDLTNQATLVVWSTKITVVDMIWGAFVSGVGAAGGCAITRLIVKG